MIETKQFKDDLLNWFHKINDKCHGEKHQIHIIFG